LLLTLSDNNLWVKFTVSSVHDAVFRRHADVSLLGMLGVYVNSTSSGFETHIKITAGLNLGTSTLHKVVYTGL